MTDFCDRFEMGKVATLVDDIYEEDIEGIVKH